MANYAQVENNKIIGVYDFLPKNWKNVSNFNLIENVDILSSHGWFKIEKVIPEYDTTTQKIDNPKHHFENNVVYETYDIIDLPPKTKSLELSEEQKLEIKRKREEIIVSNIRTTREQLMKDFEWRYNRYERQVRLGITPTDNIVKMDEYMNALADITKQSDLTNVVWPNYDEKSE